MYIFHIIIGAGVLFYALTCLAFMDIARKNFGSLAIKVMWGFIVFIPFQGVILYMLFGFRAGKGGQEEVSPQNNV